MKDLTQKYLSDLSYQIIGAAIVVHKELGPGLLEKVYEECMVYELRSRGIQVTRQQQVPVMYRGIYLETDLKYDLLVEGCIVVELKTSETWHPVFEAQILTYMRLLNVAKGVIINFYCTNIFKDGQKTMVNQMFKNLPVG